MTRFDMSRRRPTAAWRPGAGLLVAVWLLVAGGRPLGAQAPAGEYAAADIQFGSGIYAAQCAVCHGSTGDTIAGVDLRSGRFRRATTDNELRGIITKGIPGTAMPPFKLDPPQLTMLVAYLRNMRDFESRSVALGDPARGRALFEGSAGCATCHRVNGKGPRVAPDLSAIGASRSAAELERTIVDPSAAIRPVNRSIRAVKRDGTVVSGRRLNEDTYTVQIIDERERLLSITKADLQSYTVIMSSTMPAYKDKLTPSELADVVAYLPP
jgi:putative heme-binding domain-containing protein